jgi:hypothetical protein
MVLLAATALVLTACTEGTRASGASTATASPSGSPSELADVVSSRAALPVSLMGTDPVAVTQAMVNDARAALDDPTPAKLGSGYTDDSVVDDFGIGATFFGRASAVDAFRRNLREYSGATWTAGYAGQGVTAIEERWDFTEIRGGTIQLIAVAETDGGKVVHESDYYQYFDNVPGGQPLEPDPLASTPGPADTAEAAAGVAREYATALMDGDAAAIGALSAPGISFLDTASSTVGATPEDVQVHYDSILASAEDLAFTNVRHAFGAGWAAVLWTATTGGSWPDGEGMTMLEIRDGQIARETLYYNSAYVPFEMPAGSPGNPTPTLDASIDPAATCPPGSTPDEPGPIGQARPPGRTSPMTFDRDSHQIVALIGLNRDEPARARLWAFDVCTNTWSRMGPGVPLGNDDDAPALVYDPGTDRILLIGQGWVRAYEPDGRIWTRSDAPTDHRGFGPDAVFDTATGRFFVMDDAGTLWDYDSGTDTWRRIAARPEPSDPALGLQATQILAYVASADRLVLHLGYCPPEGAVVGSAATWEFDPRTRRWAEQRIATPSIGDLSCGWSLPSGGSPTYDEVSGRMVVHTWEDGFVAYDAVVHAWSIVGATAPEPRSLRGSDAVVYDPINARVVVYGDGLWAFDVAARAWTQLLAPSE